MKDFNLASIDYRKKRTDEALSVLIGILLSINVYIPSTIDGILVKETSDHLKWNCIYTNEKLIPANIKKDYKVIKTSFTEFYKFRMNNLKHTNGVAIDCENDETKIFLEDSFFMELFKIVFEDLSVSASN